ncbi:hypothetical protein BH18ACI2_BH18ACI2_04410 [soil metagenome]
MTNEEMQKTMQFILEQQAQFTVGMQELKEAHAGSEKRITQLEGAMVGVVNMFGKLTEAQIRQAEAQKISDTKMAELAEAQKQTDEQMRHTDERLSALINVVERYFSDRRNGKPQNPEDAE